MGLLKSLGRLWGGPGETRNDGAGNGRGPRGEAAGRRPVAIDLHTPGRDEDVAAIDRELSDRLGLKPSPMPGRQHMHAEVIEAPVAVGAVEGPGAAGDPHGAHHGVAHHGAAHNGNMISALLALPGDARGRARSKQQVLDQLRENYEEVIRVVRKVDSTLDQQHRRGERMLEIAEHTVHGRLPELREETRKVADAIERLSTGIGRGQDRLEKGVSDQIAAIERVQDLLGQMVDADRSLGESLVEFRRTAAGMAVATERLGTVMAGVQERASRRDEQIAQVLDRSQRTLVTVLVLSLVSVAAAITMVVLAVV
jgi:hypothetical protein